MLAAHTASGAATMVEKTEHKPETLRSMITSPGGVTEKVIQTLEDEGLKATWGKALSDGCSYSERL